MVSNFYKGLVAIFLKPTPKKIQSIKQQPRIVTKHDTNRNNDSALKKLTDSSTEEYYQTFMSAVFIHKHSRKTHSEEKTTVSSALT